MRYGDLNIDGFPDIFLTLVVEDKDESLKYKSLVLFNHGCLIEEDDDNYCGKFYYTEPEKSVFSLESDNIGVGSQE